jgi:spermidine synthase
MHGVQYAAAEEKPTSYYGPETGIGWALAQRPPGVPSRVGVVGLGVGTLAAYGRPGDRFRFYEIDPAVIQIARDPRHFSYLARSAAEIEVVEGDGRISLAAERARGDPRFDILVIDAYSSDAVPIHLLTREALALYLDALEESGLLAVHVSSLHFDLVPLLARLAASSGLPILAIRNAKMPSALSARAVWAFLSRDAARLRSLERFVRSRQIALGREPDAVILRPTPEKLAAAPLWTDDYSDLFAALKPLHSEGDRKPGQRR